MIHLDLLAVSSRMMHKNDYCVVPLLQLHLNPRYKRIQGRLCLDIFPARELVRMQKILSQHLDFSERIDIATVLKIKEMRPKYVGGSSDQ